MNTIIKEEDLDLEHSKPESKKIAKVVEQLKYVIDVIPVDVLTMEILTDENTGERYFYNNDIKIILPKDDADENCHSVFKNDYKILEDGKSVIERVFELEQLFISTVIETLELFISVFEKGLATEELKQRYDHYMDLAEKMIKARFDNEVVEALNFVFEVSDDNSNYENILYLHQLAAYNIFSEKLNQLKGD